MGHVNIQKQYRKKKTINPHKEKVLKIYHHRTSIIRLTAGHRPRPGISQSPRIGKFTHIIQLLRRIVQVVSRHHTIYSIYFIWSHHLFDWQHHAVILYNFHASHDYFVTSYDKWKFEYKYHPVCEITSLYRHPHE